MDVRRDPALPVTAARVRPWTVAATATLGWATFMMAVLHVVSSRSPVRDTISSYTATDRGAGILEASVLSLAIGSAAVVGALLIAGVPLDLTSSVLFGAWTVGLALAAIFPASYGTSGNAMSGEIHQYASLIAFLSLPGAIRSLIDKLRDQPGIERLRVLLSRLLVISLVCLALFALAYLVAAFPEVPVLDELSTVMPVGLAQRLALLADLTLLGTLVVVARRVARLRPVEVATETGGSTLG
ncbi:uncharacterized protein DUF998 [Herbihabitans rhizosphaerae]|uniref:Uncharacterized protein DUF998 n=1 Tax=Herbihabitans rhizosphaerae TaxID=1872711 RepID=A0A4Q7KPX9_9PSEU|nr:DUF998 domain-containing protein [Herbihabitans rhizosphaerae]RZS38858.1 uncharacterized protein DUF998 [Herbihabitans rhizosphaerae]